MWWSGRSYEKFIQFSCGLPFSMTKARNEIESWNFGILCEGSRETKGSMRTITKEGPHLVCTNLRPCLINWTEEGFVSTGGCITYAINSTVIAWFMRYLVFRDSLQVHSQRAQSWNGLFPVSGWLRNGKHSGIRACLRLGIGFTNF